MSSYGLSVPTRKWDKHIIAGHETKDSLKLFFFERKPKTTASFNTELNSSLYSIFIMTTPIILVFYQSPFD